MKPQYQKIVDNTIGDCFRACMASLLELPADVLPNDHSPAWFGLWQYYLEQFGLGLSSSVNPKDPLYTHEPWIASVKSKNYKDGTHAILVHEGARVLFDPSTKKRYKKNESIFDDIKGGYHLKVTDASKLHYLNEYKLRLNP